MNASELQARIEASLRDLPGARGWSIFRSDLRLDVDAPALEPTMRRIRDLGMDMLVDLTVVDLLEYPDAVDRYRIVYQLLDTQTGARLEVRTHVNDPQPRIPTMTGLWRSADWMEREAYDMFGVAFDGHPNPKRLLLPEAFTAFPLRKDYPVKGRGERHNFPVITRSES